MYSYKVGGYFYGQPRPMVEGCTLNYDASGPMLVVSLRGMTDKEAEKVRRGKMEFALFEKDKILFFLVKIPGVLEWSDAPFHIGLYSDGRQVPNDIPDGSGWGLTVIGVESRTGQIKALRLIGLGTEISKEMIRIINSQEETSQVEHHNRIAKIYREYDCDRMVKHATARYKVGEDL